MSNHPKIFQTCIVHKVHFQDCNYHSILEHNTGHMVRNWLYILYIVAEQSLTLLKSYGKSRSHINHLARQNLDNTFHITFLFCSTQHNNNRHIHFIHSKSSLSYRFHIFHPTACIHKDQRHQYIFRLIIFFLLHKLSISLLLDQYSNNQARIIFEG